MIVDKGRRLMRFATLRGAIALCLTCIAATCLNVGLAQAQAPNPLPEVVEENLSSVARYAMRESLDPTTACPKPCSDIVDDLARPATVTKDPVPASLVKSQFDNRLPGVEKLFKPRLPGWLLPGTGLLIGANLYVWKVRVLGAHPKDYWVHLSANAVNASGLSWQLVDGTDDSLYPTFFSKPSPLPVGAVATTYPRGTVIWQGDSGRCSEPALEPTPSDVEVFTWHWNRCFEGWFDGVEVFTSLIAHGWKSKVESFFDPSLDPPGNPDMPTPLLVDPGDLTLEELKDRIRAQLESDDPNYDVLRNWLCSVFGGPCKNPRDTYYTTPDCTGMTAAVCIQAFRNAGFTGTITTETLDADQAVLEVGAGKVPATYPHEGVEIAEPQPITVYVNPDPMPTMTIQETALANTLETQNPDTVNDTNKKTIAVTCARDMTAAGRSINDCELLPIMVIGNDQETPARNALQGLIRNPSWVVLNARSTTGISRNDWYSNLGEPAPGCLDAEREPANASCDEFPFFSTMQAHGGTLNTLTPSIRWAPIGEQQRQAAVISQFYSNNNPGPVMTFHGCDLTKQQPTEIIPTVSSAFVVLPLPFSSAIKSTGICNKPLTP